MSREKVNTECHRFRNEIEWPSYHLGKGLYCICLCVPEPRFTCIKDKILNAKQDVGELLKLSGSIWKRIIKVSLLIPMKINCFELYFDENLLLTMKYSWRKSEFWRLCGYTLSYWKQPYTNMKWHNNKGWCVCPFAPILACEVYIHSCDVRLHYCQCVLLWEQKHLPLAKAIDKTSMYVAFAVMWMHNKAESNVFDVMYSRAGLKHVFK